MSWPLQLQPLLPASDLGKRKAEGPNSWPIQTMWETWTTLLTPGSVLAEARLFWKISLSFSLCATLSVTLTFTSIGL